MSKKNVDTTVKDERLVQKRRKQMIKAGVTLFTQKGFHRTTTREIAREAGFSIGTLYEYIRSKEDVLYLVCDDIYDRVKSRLEQHLDLNGAPLESLKLAIENYVHVVDELQDEMLVMYQELKSLSKDALPYVLNKEDEMAAIFEDLLERCRETDMINVKQKDIQFYAHQILVQCQMWSFRRWAFQKRYDAQSFAELQVQVIVEGLRSRG